jgi:outer membrane protein insertion porin family
MKISYLIILIFSLCNTGLAQTDSLRVAEIKFFGNHEFKNELLLNLIHNPPDTPFYLAAFRPKLNQLLEFYRAQGFYHCAIDSAIARIDSSRQQVAVEIFLNEGPRFRLQSLRFRGDSLPEWTNRLETKTGQPLNTSRLQQDIEFGLTRAENHGQPLAEIRIDSLEMSSPKTHSGKLELVLRQEAGPQIFINEMTVQGNQVTRTPVITRETRIRTGEMYRQDKIDKIPRRLMRLGFFQTVEAPELYLKENGVAGLLIKVQETRANQFDGVIGYIPGTTTQKGYFTGLLDFSLGNLLGTGRKISTHWEKKSRETQEFTFGYLEPWLFNYPVHAGFQFQQLIQDSTYLQRNWEGKIELPLTENLGAFTQVGTQSVIPDSLGMETLGIPKSTAQFVSLGFQFDTRDDLLNPRRGMFYQTSFKFNRKHSSVFQGVALPAAALGQFNQQEIWLDLETYWEIFPLQVLSGNLHTRQISSKEEHIPLPEQFRLGGARTLRGYREEQFTGTRVAWLNLEYRYLLSRRARVFAFTDLGYFSRTTQEKNQIEDHKFGFGFGLRIETRLGIMGVDYGLGEGSGLLGGLIHVGLVNEF